MAVGSGRCSSLRTGGGRSAAPQAWPNPQHFGADGGNFAIDSPSTLLDRVTSISPFSSAARRRGVPPAERPFKPFSVLLNQAKNSHAGYGEGGEGLDQTQVIAACLAAELIFAPSVFSCCRAGFAAALN